MVRHAPRRAAWLLCTLLCTLLCASCGDASGGPPDGAAGAASRGASRDGQAGAADFEALRARAVALHDRGDDPGAARAAVEAALALQPEHYGLNQRLARLCLDLRLNEAALAALLRCHATRPDDLPTLLSIVSLEVSLGRFDEALLRIPAVVDDPALRGEALYQQALALEQQGAREAARAAAQAAAGLPPERGYRCAALLGRMALEDGDFAAAHAQFRRARDGRPDHREALKGLADSARRLGQEDEAARWDRLLGLYLQLNDSVFARTPEQSAARRALLETLLAEDPAWSAGYEQLAELQLAAEDRRAACATMEAWLGRHGQDLPSDAVTRLRQRYCAGAR